MTLGDIIERNALLYPHHPALVFEGRTITHREHAERAHRLANALAARGLAKGDRVAVLSQNRPEYIEAYSACEVAGFITVGINYRLSVIEQAAILEDCAPAALVIEAQYADRIDALGKALPADCTILWLDRDGYEAALAAASPARPALRSGPDDTAFMVYTSGSTGRPKGVMHSHKGFVEMTRCIAQLSRAGQDDRMLIVMPYYHVGAKIEQSAYSLVGATVILHRAFDPTVILESMSRERVTAAHLAPTMVQAMLEVYDAKRHDLEPLHTVCYASAPMSIALLQRAIAAFGPIFMQVYGMTECPAGSVLYKHQHRLEGDPKWVKRLASAGQPFIECEMRIVREDGSDCAVGEIGEIWGRSNAMMQGYWRNPEAYAAAVTADGWMKTGDMGYFDDEHFLFVADRKKDMIISGGENIYSREVEEALMLHPAVLEAAVIGVPDEKWGESVKAFVSFREGMRATPEEIIEHCRTLIASYKKPRSVEIMAALPRLSSTNKIDKKALRAPYWKNETRQVA